MNNSPRKTKIICTIGPAIETREKLLEITKAGMDVARLNFSHGGYEWFKLVIAHLRSIEKELVKPIGILADVQGPKLRIGQLENGHLVLTPKSEIWITTDNLVGGLHNGKTVVSVAYKEFINDVDPGHFVLLDDGMMTLKTLERKDGMLRCEVIHGGVLKPNKGINVPTANFSAQPITEKDYEDILFCLEQEVDFIALSFVRSAQEIRHLKNFIHSRSKNTQVLAKIEKREALQYLDEIIDASDGILVARGDLAVEVGNEKVPVLQKKIVRRCNLRGKSVIIATQMLMSMVDNPRPSRAEASDVANGIVDEADALMLSNETAVGKYPTETVSMMNKIIHEMEAEPTSQPILFDEWLLPAVEQYQVALLQSAVRMASIVKAKCIVVVTESGLSATLVAKCRPSTRVIAITGNLTTFRQLSLKWGIHAIFMEDMNSLIPHTSVFEAIAQRLLAKNMVQTKDKIIITAGLPRLAHGSTNTIKIQEVG